ncbi:MAG: tetratricopeptide repeat protein [Paracoccaceae bacterium]
MKLFSSIHRILPVLALGLFLAACDTAEERAQAHYERAKTLLAEGEVQKAIVEFRNVFKLNGKLVAARMDFADLMLEQGQPGKAIAHYNLIVELEPRNLDARRKLSALMLQFQKWDSAERHLKAALKEAPDDPELLGMRASLDYRDEKKRDEAIDLARSVLEKDPAQLSARLVVIASYADTGANDKALEEVDKALALTPDSLQLHMIRLITLERIGDQNGLGDQLKRMIGLFPDNLEVRKSMIRWHLGRNDLEGAEKAIRDLAATDPADVGLAMSVVTFLEQTKGLDAAREELVRLAGGDVNARVFRAALARLDYQMGRSEDAFKEASSLLADARDDAEKADAKILLAQLYLASDDRESAMPLVSEVLAIDDSDVDALMLKAKVEINDDQPQIAIQHLRTALNQSPDNAKILSMLAEAHVRNGSPDLARDRLAQAVDVSKGGVAESLAYANFLASEDNLPLAEDVIVASTRVHPANTDLLKALADIRLRRENWEGALEVARTLRAIDPKGQGLAAESIEVSTLAGQKRFGESIARIEKILDEQPNDRALAGLVQLYFQTGQVAKAEEVLRSELSRNPDNTNASMLLAAVLESTERAKDAEETYRAMIEAKPDFAPAYIALGNLLEETDRSDEADQVLAAGAEATGHNTDIQLIRSSRAERAGDFDTAIAILDELYRKSPGSLVLANNLASLLSDHRNDAESQERARRIAARLRKSGVPAFNDTYGWVLYKQGNYSRALVPLQMAATGLPDNPIVAYHYGMALAETSQREKAIAQLKKAIKLAGEDSPLPQIAEARKKIEALASAPAE